MTVQTGSGAIASGNRLAKARVSDRSTWTAIGVSSAFVAVTLLYLTMVVGPLRLLPDSVTYLALGLGIAPPKGHQGYPSGYPELLRIVNHVGLGSAWGLVAVNLVLLAVGVAVVYRLCRRPLGLSPTKAALVCLAVLLSHVVSQLVPSPVSDIPCFAAAMLCLWALTEAETRSGRSRIGLLLIGTLLALIAISIRTQALALVPAVVFVAIGAPNLRRGWQVVRRHPRLAIGTSPFLLLAFIAATVFLIRATPYSHDFARQWRDINSVGGFLARLGAETKAKLMSVGELAGQAHCCVKLSPSYAPFFEAAGLGVLVLLLLGWRQRPRLGAIEVFVLSTAFVVLVYWAVARFWLPALPFMMVYLLFAGERLARFRPARPALILFLAAFAAAGIGWLVYNAVISTAGRKQFPGLWATQAPLLAPTYRVAFGEPRPGDERRVSRPALGELRRYEPLARR